MKSMIRQRHKVKIGVCPYFSKSFTLVEILIAVTLLLVIAIAVFTTFRGGTLAWERGIAHARRDAEARAVLEMMARELSTATLVVADGDYQIDFYATEGSIHFVAPTEAPRPGHPDIMKVFYELKGGRIIRATDRIGEDITDFPDPPPDGFPALASHITELTFRFLDNQPPFVGEPWERSSWDSRRIDSPDCEDGEIYETVGTLPDAIEIRFTFDYPDDRLPAKEFSTIVVSGRRVPPFEIELSLSPSSGEVTQGHSISTAVTPVRTSGEPHSIDLSVVIPSGLSGVTHNFPIRVSPPFTTATLTFNAGLNATPGIHLIEVRGSIGGRVLARAFYTLHVVLPPVLNVTPLTIDAELVIDTGWTRIGTVRVRNIGEGTLHWFALEAIGWLRINVTSDTTRGETDFVGVCVNTLNFAPGVYTGDITFTGAGMTKTVAVTLTATTTPTVVTRAATSITETGARLNARIVTDGLTPILDRRFEWGTDPGGAGWAEVENVSVSGDYFWFNLSGLTPGTTYYFRARSRNAVGWSVGAILSFTTADLNVSPTTITHTLPRGVCWTWLGTVISVTNAGEGTLTWSASDNRGWIWINVTGGTTTTETDLVGVSLTTAGLPLGSHTGHITFTSGAGVIRNVTVILNVIPPPNLCVLPLTINATLPQGTGWRHIATVGVRNIGEAPLTWSASITAGIGGRLWISDTGDTTIGTGAETDSVDVWAHTHGLTVGLHIGTIRFTGAPPVDGSPDIVTVRLTVLNAPPTASFTWSPHPPAAEEAIGFRDTSTDVAPGRIVRWAWSFGDGRTSAARNPSNVFARAGTYRVTLTVTDDHGATSTRSRYVTIGIRECFSCIAGWHLSILANHDAPFPGWTGWSLALNVDPPGCHYCVAVVEVDEAHWTKNINPIAAGTVLDASGWMHLNCEADASIVAIQVYDTVVGWRDVARRSYGRNSGATQWIHFSGRTIPAGSVTRIRVYMYLEDGGGWFGDDMVHMFLDTITILAPYR